ncbi:MAG: HD domain-containing protein [Clostridiales bacterium]|jgi:uncharacterized protein|nr:HD domain-containing protein [Clostridiales bacterium]
MNNALGSRISLDDLNTSTALQYNDCVAGLLDSPEVQGLNNFSQHCNTSRLQHSINVSYYSFLICRSLNLDYRSAARAGLLHDLFLYDWRSEPQPEGKHAFAHPIVALRNARSITEINDMEADAIVNHMFPLTPTPPKYREAYIVSLADKYCAAAEFFYQWNSKFKFKIKKYLQYFSI